jgi:hypothetical protein
MRLRGIRTVPEGNGFLKQYLPVYNRRFSVRPQERSDLHRPLPLGISLDSILCIQTERTLRNDFTVAHNHKLYQIEDRTHATRVRVHEQIDGSIKIFSRGQALRFREITTRPLRELKSPVRVGRTEPHPPPPDHPWRDFKFGSRTYERRKALLNGAVAGVREPR